MTDTLKRLLSCDHKCHKVGLNPWVKACPICGCPNKDYKPESAAREAKARAK